MLEDWHDPEGHAVSSLMAELSRAKRPIRVCRSSFAVPSPHLFPAWAGQRGSGRARGAVWRVRVCDCDGGPLARDHWVCIINNEGALKKKSPDG